MIIGIRFREYSLDEEEWFAQRLSQIVFGAIDDFKPYKFSDTVWALNITRTWTMELVRESKQVFLHIKHDNLPERLQRQILPEAITYFLRLKPEEPERQIVNTSEGAQP